MLVADLHHFLDLPLDVPGPARRLAEQLGDIVRAASAGDIGAVWITALPCRRRPAHRACAGRMVVQRTEPEGPIQWRCSVCGDEGVISNWADSPFDLRRTGLSVASTVSEFEISDEVTAALHDLRLLDLDCQRLVFRIRTQKRGALLAATDDDLEQLIGFVAAEANHETNRRRQQRLDAAFEALNSAAQTAGGW